MKNIVILFLSLFCTISALPNSPVSLKKKSVLIFTKNGLSVAGKKGYVHKNIESSVRALRAICDEEKIATVVSEDSSIFTEEYLAQFDAIIFSNANNEVFETESEQVAFQNFIKNGGGFMAIHSANAVERDWPWYWALVGGKFVRHAPHQEFNVLVTDNTHPSTDFLESTWTVSDECYYSNNINPTIHVLLSADLTTVQDKKRSEYPADIFGDQFPLCWTNNFEGSKQWYTSLGHDAETYDKPIFRKHLKGGLTWVLSKN